MKFNKRFRFYGKIIYLSSLLITLSACSNQAVQPPKEVLVLTPDALMLEPCQPVGAGTTPRTLAKGYVLNTNCIEQYKLLLKKQRQHKQEQEALYNKEASK